MNVFQVFTEHVRSAVTTLAQAGVFPSPPDLSRIVVEPPREASHGDLATNAAMALAKDAGLKPRDLAEKIAAELRKLREVTDTEIAGPSSAKAPTMAVALSARASPSTSSTFRPTRPARCTSAIVAARCSATRWPICSRSPDLR
jgi:arginyl-tRNA synthetase